MSYKTPVLLLGFNRPAKMAQLIRALEQNRPDLLLIAVDGPRASHPSDADLVKQTQASTALINWNAQIETRFRNENLGLRRAVVDAVNWATSQYGQVIVIEDDCVPGPDFIPFAKRMLSDYRYAREIGHINGYNLVPPTQLQNALSPIRLTQYPESYAWATWERAWNYYDDNLTWARDSTLKNLQEITGSYLGALRWKINFADAYAERIQTWAYRWLASMWANEMFMIAPTQNLVRYDGHEDGTHTRRSARWVELPISPLSLTPIQSLSVDPCADKWLGEQVFRENLTGVIEGLVASIAMEFLKRKKVTRA